MSLLQLSPEAVRLRRIAKACAAGEMSRVEYRQVRREMIDQFAGPGVPLSEPTLSRYPADMTERRVEQADRLPAEKHFSRRIVLFLGLATVLAGAAIPLLI